MAESWDEGLSPQRTELAWGRTGLALAAAVVVLARRAWTLGGGVEVAAIVVVAVGGLVWLAGMRLSRDLHAHMEPHGLAGTRAFAPGRPRHRPAGRGCLGIRRARAPLTGARTPSRPSGPRGPRRCGTVGPQAAPGGRDGRGTR